MLCSWKGKWNDHESRFDFNSSQYRVQLKQCPILQYETLDGLCDSQWNVLFSLTPVTGA